MTGMNKFAKRVLGAAAVVSALAPAAFGQACALCYTAAAASKEGAISALRHGILILLFPPIAICLGFVTLGYRSRERFQDENEPGEWEA